MRQINTPNSEKNIYTLQVQTSHSGKAQHEGALDAARSRIFSNTKIVSTDCPWIIQSIPGRPTAIMFYDLCILLMPSGVKSDSSTEAVMFSTYVYLAFGLPAAVANRAVLCFTADVSWPPGQR